MTFALDALILSTTTIAAYLVGRSDGRDAMDRQNADEIRRIHHRMLR
ncbi:MAG: hypothetical protein INR66_21005 [Gordonia polyisoprenivorans]|nr:hypothetical protein [Gordonia polyisoprenivorans]